MLLKATSILVRHRWNPFCVVSPLESMTNSAHTWILYKPGQLIVAIVMIVVLSAVGNAQFSESFDSKIATFKRHQSDSSVDLSTWKQSRDSETQGDKESPDSA